MKAIYCLEHGPPPRLEAGNAPVPQLPSGYVRVAVQYCSLGIPDLLVLTGAYQVKPSMPFIPGCEVAGIVTDVAADVEHLAVGTRIAGLNYTFIGGLAEQAVVPACLAVELPEAVPLEIASAMLVNYGTSNYALTSRAALRPGETLLVLGAAGGVGLAAIEIGKAMGARVIAAASTEEKLALAREHGADICLDYSDESIKDELKRFGGIDVAIDPVGGLYSEQALRALRPGGRLLVVGFASGEIARIPLNLPLLKDCSINGVFLATQTRDHPERFVASMRSLFEMYERHELRPVLTQFDCFSEYDAAIEHVANRKAAGKVVMRIAE